MTSSSRISVGIVGNGVVGQATGYVWCRHVNVMAYDILPHRSAASLKTLASSCEFIFICLPTPKSDLHPTGIDSGAVYDVCEDLADMGYKGLIIIRSTLPIGTTTLLANHRYPNVLYYPCFATERLAAKEESHPDRVVIGTPGDWQDTSIDLGHKIDRFLYKLRYSVYPSRTVHVTSYEEAEAIKLMQNAFFATKVAFFNEMRALSDALDLNWELISLILGQDSRIGSEHTHVPGHDGKRGFGGKCLPKDLDCLIHMFKNARNKVSGDDYHRLYPDICYSARSRNQRDRKESE